MSRDWLAKIEARPDREDDYRSFHENTVAWRDKLKERRNMALTALPVLPIGLPILWLVFVWVRSGFRHE